MAVGRSEELFEAVGAQYDGFCASRALAYCEARAVDGELLLGLCAMTKEWLRSVVYSTFTHDTAPNTLAEYFETPGIVQVPSTSPRRG